MVMLRVVNYILPIVLVLFLVVVPALSVRAEVAEPATSPLIITELKVRNNSSGYNEFIELYNPNSTTIDLSNYSLRYFNILNPSSDLQPNSEKQLSTASYTVLPFSHVVLGKDTAGIMLPAPFTSLLDATGTIQLVTIDGQVEGVVEQISWTNKLVDVMAPGVYPPIVTTCTLQNTSCSDVAASFTRQQDQQGVYTDFDSMWISTQPSPWQPIRLVVPDDPEEPAELPENPEEEVPNPDEGVISQPTCEGLTISELLPNPAGSDIGSEYIEIHNPTSGPISLMHCSLKTTANGKVYDLPDTLLAPDAYISVPDSQSFLTLANAAGGTVWLLSPTDEVDAVSYAPDLDEDVAWAFVDGIWLPTYMPTPGMGNIDVAIKPCPEGQRRDMLTNRCQNIVSAAVSGQVSCKSGQERNPVTNRCRSVVLAGTSLTPCKPGQKRNPDTNRCRSVLSSSTLGPCPEGQERSPETNRCRKQGDSGGTLAAVSDVKSMRTAPGPAWWMFGGVILLAVGYGVYEWRNDIRGWVTKLREK